MLKPSASSGCSAANKACSTAPPAAAGITATSHATMPWRRSPPLNDCSSQPAQAPSASFTLLRSPSGRHCSISSAAMIAMTPIGVILISKPAGEVDQDPGGHAPDIALAVRDGVEGDAAALELARPALVVARIEQEREGDLEHFLDLARVGRQLKRRRQQPDHGGHAVAGARQVFRQPADDLDLPGLQADFLSGLAQRRELRARVPGLGAAAGKADLPGMAAQLGSALREPPRQAVRVRDA